MNAIDSMIEEFKESNVDKNIVFTDENLDLTMTMTTTLSQKNNKNISNITTIDLGSCEEKLKLENHIPINDSLYILMIDALKQKENNHKVEYEVYYSFNKINLTKLDLSICKDTKIEISIPINISINDIDKYNLSSDLYNDLCYTLTSEDGTDKPLKERKKESIDNNIFICEENCEFIKYDNINKKAVCSCNTKRNLPYVSDIKINKDKLLSNFKNIDNIANIKMLNCLNLFLNIDNILINSANYMLIILLILSLISIFGFLFYNNTTIKNYFWQIIEERNPIKKNINLNNNNLNNSNKKTKIKRKRQSKNKKSSSKIGKKNKELIIVSRNNIIDKSKKSKIFYNNYKINKKRFSNKINDNHNYNSLKLFLTKDKVKSISNNKKNKFRNEIQIYNDIEINSFTYEEAIKNDKRTFFQFYFSLLKSNHILIFSCFNIKDYNSQFIKIYLFFFTFAINLTISALFYFDDTMSKIYADKGSFDFIYQLPQMLYSFLISSLLNNLLNTLGLYENNVLDFKTDKNKDLKNIKKFLFLIKIKIVFFFIITYILLIAFWLFLGCFCAVYKNTQIHLLYDVSSSFAISFITPFFILLLPGIFRILSLKSNKGKRPNKPVMFKFSKILEMLLLFCS